MKLVHPLSSLLICHVIKKLRCIQFNKYETPIRSGLTSPKHIWNIIMWHTSTIILDRQGKIIKIQTKCVLITLSILLRQHLASHFEKCSLAPAFSSNSWSLLNFLPKCSIFSLSFLETCFLGQAFLSIAKSYSCIRIKFMDSKSW